MKASLRKVWKLLQNPRLVLALFVYLVLFSVLATLLATTESQTGNISGLYQIIASIRPQLALFGLDKPYSSLWLLVPALLLMLCTIVCSVVRTQVAIKRYALLKELQELSPAMLAQRGEHITAGSVSREESTTALREFGFRLKQTRSSESNAAGQQVYARHAWALYASPVFHWLLVALIAVVLIGQMTRFEGKIMLALDQKLPLTAANMTTIKKGPLYRFPTKPMALGVSKIDMDHKAQGVEQGTTLKVDLYSSAGKRVKSQYVYPNSALTYGGLMVHRLEEFGLAAHFVLGGAATNDSAPLIVPMSFASAEKDATLPARFQLDDPKTGRVLGCTYILYPAYDDNGNPRPVKLSEARGVLYIQDAETGEKVYDKDIYPGQTATIMNGVTIKLDKVTYGGTLYVVDDWSVRPLYVLFCLAILALAIALLTSPAIVVVGTGEDNGVYAYARFFRPSSCTPQDVYETLQDASERIQTDG